MSRLEWQENVHALQAGPMDTAHQEFIVLTNALAEAADGDELACLSEIFLHCKEHFAQEELWMQASHMAGTENHMRDHAGVLTLLESAASDLRAGRQGAGRELAESLASWFSRHVATLDTGLAFHMEQAQRAARVGNMPAIG